MTLYFNNRFVLVGIAAIIFLLAHVIDTSVGYIIAETILCIGFGIHAIDGLLSVYNITVNKSATMQRVIGVNLWQWRYMPHNNYLIGLLNNSALEFVWFMPLLYGCLYFVFMYAMYTLMLFLSCTIVISALLKSLQINHHKYLHD